MPQASIDALRRVIAEWNSGDLDRIVAFIHPDFEGQVTPEFSAEPDTYRGHEGVRRYFQSFWEGMDDIRFEPQRMWEAGDSVAVDMLVTARGKHTQIVVEQRVAQVWTMRDGKALRALTYPTLARALQAAGLPPDDDDAG